MIQAFYREAYHISASLGTCICDPILPRKRIILPGFDNYGYSLYQGLANWLLVLSNNDIIHNRKQLANAELPVFTDLASLAVRTNRCRITVGRYLVGLSRPVLALRRPVAERLRTQITLESSVVATCGYYHERLSSCRR